MKDKILKLLEDYKYTTKVYYGTGEIEQEDVIASDDFESLADDVVRLVESQNTNYDQIPY